ncbi:MAG: magnesium and cobalt transport protein CorA [Bacteroidetes bacterium]|nr:MAG: magnesium and cobalt transport protein CorA [Bacteroidota bacterium]
MNTYIKRTIKPLTQITKLLKSSKERTQAVVHPFKPPTPLKTTDQPLKIDIYDYNHENIHKAQPDGIEACLAYRRSQNTTWINLEGGNEEGIKTIITAFDIHYLIQEDILSYGQRPKLDEMDDMVFVLLYMLYDGQEGAGIETEQISIVLLPNTVISIQQDLDKDVFDGVRQKLNFANTKLRQSNADYLFYTLIDTIVDSYFGVLEKLGERITAVEEMLMKKPTKTAYAQINQLRKEIILLKRNTAPVRDLVSNLLRNDSKLINERTNKYFKDVYDHIIQANELTENYRDMVMGLQDLYMNNINLRTNEVMKTMAIVTTVMAPATVIGGIFGMNFDVIPYRHQEWGFYGTVAAMLLIPIGMILWFRMRGWFAKDLPNHE